ncbi:MAG: hypothetical protein ABEI57_08630 [Halapricum sp.]
MVAVNTVDGIKYGFRLLGYLIAVFLIGGAIAGVGGAMVEDSPAVGGLIAIVGIVVIYAGFLGTMYKVIADGVEAGNIAAEQGGAPPAGNAPTGAPQAGNPRAGNQPRR